MARQAAWTFQFRFNSPSIAQVGAHQTFYKKMKMTRKAAEKALLAVVLVMVVQAVVASVSGFKIYGRPVVIDNRPLLRDSLMIDHLEAPNVVVTSSGEHLLVEGVIFEEWAITSPPADLSKYFNDSEPIRLVGDPRQPSGVAFEWKIHYFCGNTFFPHFLPRPLPRYQVADFGRGLVSRMLSRKLHPGEAFNNPANKEILEAEAAPEHSLPAAQFR